MNQTHGLCTHDNGDEGIPILNDRIISIAQLLVDDDIYSEIVEMTYIALNYGYYITNTCDAINNVIEANFASLKPNIVTTHYPLPRHIVPDNTFPCSE